MKNSKVEAKQKNKVMLPTVSTNFNTNFWRETCDFSVRFARIWTSKPSCQLPLFLTTCNNPGEKLQVASQQNSETLALARPFTSFCFLTCIWFIRNTRCNYARAALAFQKIWNFLLKRLPVTRGQVSPRVVIKRRCRTEQPSDLGSGWEGGGSEPPPPNTSPEANRALLIYFSRRPESAPQRRWKNRAPSVRSGRLRPPRTA